MPPLESRAPPLPSKEIPVKQSCCLPVQDSVDARKQACTSFFFHQGIKLPFASEPKGASTFSKDTRKEDPCWADWTYSPFQNRKRLSLKFPQAFSRSLSFSPQRANLTSLIAVLMVLSGLFLFPVKRLINFVFDIYVNAAILLCVSL